MQEKIHIKRPIRHLFREKIVTVNLMGLRASLLRNLCSIMNDNKVFHVKTIFFSARSFINVIKMEMLMTTIIHYPSMNG